MEIIYFLVAGIAVYFGADWLLTRLEVKRGRRFEHRDIIYFFIFLVLALTLFWLIQHLAQPGGGTQ